MTGSAVPSLLTSVGLQGLVGLLFLAVVVLLVVMVVYGVVAGGMAWVLVLLFGCLRLLLRSGHGAWGALRAHPFRTAGVAPRIAPDAAPDVTARLSG